MKAGILVECGPEGMEVHLCRRIAELVVEETGIDLEVDIVPMDDKEALLEQCGGVALRLLNAGCDRVVILWDERPAWPDKKQKQCRRRERGQIFAELDKVGLADGPVFLVRIEREIESWLLFDEQMLSNVLSRPAHRVRAEPPQHPHKIPNPKGAMMTLFEKHGQRYVATLGKKFAASLTGLRRMRKCKTFRRFIEKLTQ